MAEFSKEWCDLKDNGFPYDFSVLEEFAKLEDGESIVMICEGFGFTHIVNEGSECHVVVRGELIPFEKLKY